MEKTISILRRLSWHAALWSSAVAALSLSKVRLQNSWDEKCRDGAAGDSIVSHFEASFEEGEQLKRSLFHDLRQRLESIFPIDKLMVQLEGLTGDVDQIRPQKLALWEEIKIEVISRMIVSHYGRRILERFITTGMALVGKSLYLRYVLKEHCSAATEDLRVTNRIFMSLAARFIQYGVPLLAESVKNVVQLVFGQVSLQEPTTLTLMDSLIGRVRHEIESACGKSVLDECIFGRLEELVGSDLPPSRRRLFIALVTECRRRMKDPATKSHMLGLVKSDIDIALFQSIQEGCETDEAAIKPLLAVVAKLGKNFHKVLATTTSSADLASNRRLAVLIFVDCDSDIQATLMPHSHE